jgi:CBS-domain-containing membrane protein
MTVALVSISPDATVAEAARRMHRAQIRRLPVIGEGGRLVGIISRGDLLKVFDRPDHAIQREIPRRRDRRRVHDGPKSVLHPRR